MKASDARAIAETQRFVASEAGEIVRRIAEEAAKGELHLAIASQHSPPLDRSLDKLRSLGYAIILSRSGKVVAYWGEVMGGQPPCWLYEL